MDQEQILNYLNNYERIDLLKVNNSYYSFCVNSPLNEEVELVNNSLRQYYYTEWTLIGRNHRHDFTFASAGAQDPMLNLTLLTYLSQKHIWFKNLQYSLIPGMFVFKLDLI